MSEADPTAAERMRRYRQRQREIRETERADRETLAEVGRLMLETGRLTIPHGMTREEWGAFIDREEERRAAAKDGAK